MAANSQTPYSASQVRDYRCVLPCPAERLLKQSIENEIDSGLHIEVLTRKRELKVTLAVNWAWEPDQHTDFQATELEWRLAGDEKHFHKKQIQQGIQRTYATRNHAVGTGGNWFGDKKLRTIYLQMRSKARIFTKPGKGDLRMRKNPDQPCGVWRWRTGEWLERQTTQSIMEARATSKCAELVEKDATTSCSHDPRKQSPASDWTRLESLQSHSTGAKWTWI